MENGRSAKTVLKPPWAQGAVYVDMDGVLAKWRNVPVECTRERGYFLGLEKEEVVAELIRLLQRRNWNVAILTAAYSDTNAKEEKLKWLVNNGLQVRCIVVPYGQAKADYVDKGGTKVLLDDYSNNLREWQSAGSEFVPVKFYNGINGTKRTWHGRFVSHTMDVMEMVRVIEDAVLF